MNATNIAHRRRRQLPQLVCLQLVTGLAGSDRAPEGRWAEGSRLEALKGSTALSLELGRVG